MAAGTMLTSNVGVQSISLRAQILLQHGVVVVVVVGVVERNPVMDPSAWVSMGGSHFFPRIAKAWLILLCLGVARNDILPQTDLSPGVCLIFNSSDQWAGYSQVSCYAKAYPTPFKSIFWITLIWGEAPSASLPQDLCSRLLRFLHPPRESK